MPPRDPAAFFPSKKPDAKVAARQQRAAATKASNAAVASEQKARDRATQIEKERDRIRALNEELLATQKQLQSTLYAAHMNLAQHAWEARGVDRVRQLLKQHRAKPGETDLRGFEWYYLYQLSHAELLTVEGHNHAVHFVAFSPDGSRLVSAGGTVGNPGELMVWDARTGKPQVDLKGHTDWVSEAVFSPDGKLLASGANDKTIRIWDVDTGQTVRVLEGSSGFVRSVAFSPEVNKLPQLAEYTGIPVRRRFGYGTPRPAKNCLRSRATQQVPAAYVSVPTANESFQAAQIA